MHGSLWADGAGSASRAGNVPFLNENQDGGGKKGLILLQIKSFTNDGKLGPDKDFFFLRCFLPASDLPPTSGSVQRDPRSSGFHRGSGLRPRSLPAAFHVLFCVHV